MPLGKGDLLHVRIRRVRVAVGQSVAEVQGLRTNREILRRSWIQQVQSQVAKLVVGIDHRVPFAQFRKLSQSVESVKC